MIKESFEQAKSIYLDSPFNNLIGITIEEFTEEQVVYSLLVTEKHMNVNGTLHGGVYFTMLDTTVGALARVKAGYPVVTINMNINYFSAVMKGETIKAFAKILREGRNIIAAEGELVKEDGEIAAKATGTFKVLHKQDK
ncbi:MAG: PaaI family thioesterase [Bacillus sp. (in: firmicutes)]